jgi:ribokinase
MIIVFGSINMDMVMPVGRFPTPGETVLAGGYEMMPGGKGANQALAAARMGGKVALVGCVGDDGVGLRMLNGLRRDSVMTSGIGTSPLPTGMAVILTGPDGENEIIAAAGANADAKADQVPDEILKPVNLLLMQGETAPEENWILLERAKKRGVTTILNLAPAIAIPREALANIDYLIVNQIEARQIAEALKIDLDHDAAKLAHALAHQGKLTCIITLGAEGCIGVAPNGPVIRVPALKLDNVVDTTGAGDAYCGTFAAAIYSKKTLTDAMKLASIAGTLSCMKRGAQDSYAYIYDIEAQLDRLEPATTEKI